MPLDRRLEVPVARSRQRFLFNGALGSKNLGPILREVFRERGELAERDRPRRVQNALGAIGAALPAQGQESVFHNGLDPQDTGATNAGEIYFTDDASRMGVVVENNLAVASGSAADAMAFVNPPTSGLTDNFSMGAGSTAIFTDPTGTNPNFRLTSTGVGSIVGKGTRSNAPMTDIGFDPKCIVAGSPGSGISWAQNSVNYEYTKSLGGVAGCFHPGARPSGSPPDLSAHQSNAQSATVPSMAGAVACVPGTGGTGLVGFIIGPDGGLIEAGSPGTDGGVSDADAGGSSQQATSEGGGTTADGSLDGPGAAGMKDAAAEGSTGEGGTGGLGPVASAPVDAGGNGPSSEQSGWSRQNNADGCEVGAGRSGSGWFAWPIAAVVLAGRRRRHAARVGRRPGGACSA